MAQTGREGEGGPDKVSVVMEAFDVAATVSFILRNGFERVALQFPDALLKESVAVTSALKKEISKQQKESISRQLSGSGSSVCLFVMADTTFGSCCADEVTAMHVDAQCIVHYGHTCLSATSRLPVWFVFGRTPINIESCATSINGFAASKKQQVLVMFGLAYAYALPEIREQVYAIQENDSDITFVATPSQLMEPSAKEKASEEGSYVGKPSADQNGIRRCRMDASDGPGGQCCDDNTDTFCGASKVESVRAMSRDSAHKSRREGSEFSVGGLKWVVPKDRGMEDYIILWIGDDDDPALTNMALTFNSSMIVRHDREERKVVTDVVKQSKLLQRRYYLVERAKDANLVGIVVGTLGVAGYGETIQRIRAMVQAAGKKSYVLVMGKPNPSKLANFPECDVFVLVACPQTALLDSKDFLAPIITPFEAELAFVKGKQWTGAYRLDFGMAPTSDHDTELAPENSNAEPRFSFFTGSYVGEGGSQDRDADDVSSRAVVTRASQLALQLQSDPSSSVVVKERRTLDIKSGAEYLAARTYQGLDIHHEESPCKPSLAVVGRKGRASAYTAEIGNS